MAVVPLTLQMQGNLRNTVTQIKRLMGKKFSEPSVQAEASKVLYNITSGTDGAAAVSVSYMDKTQTFDNEQILGALLAKLRDTVSAAVKTNCPDCVIAVPVYYTQAQRQAILNAAKIADVNVLRLINEPTAAALSYGLPRMHEYADDTPTNVIFFDMGHSQTTASMVSFTKSQIKVLASAFDRNLGGRDFDEVLVQHFAAEFLAKTKIDIRSTPKSMHRLRSGVEKLKVQLSGNRKMPINVECLYEERDFSSSMERYHGERGVGLIYPGRNLRT